MRLIAFPQQAAEFSFLATIAELFSQSFSLDLVEGATNNLDLSPYQGQLSLAGHPKTDLPSLQVWLPDAPDQFDVQAWDGLSALKLASQLSQFIQKLSEENHHLGSETGQLRPDEETQTKKPEPTVDFQRSLDQLPLHLAISDHKGQVLYHNGRPKDPFFLDQIDTGGVEDWIIEEIKGQASHSFHLLLPAISLDQILMQSYYGLYDQGELRGIIDQVQDIKPLLASYLKETGQALVGWSDTTSGASIKNSLFDEEEF